MAGMPPCSKCQADLPVDARFCPACGSAVEVAGAAAGVAGDGDHADDWTRLVDAPHPMAPPVPEPEPEQALEPEPSDAYEPAFVPLRAEDLTGPRRSTPLWPLAIVALVIAILAGGWFGWSLIAGLHGDGVQVAAAGDDGPPADPRPQWQQNYVDNYLSDAPVELVTASNANVRDYPATEGTQVLRLLPLGTNVTGRWVSGAEGTLRWLKLNDGGYLREDVVAVVGGEGSPITIPFNRDSDNFGPEVNAMITRLGTGDTGDSGTQGASSEDMENYGAVPPRRWRGLTLTGVASFYEASGIIFADDVAALRRALVAGGMAVAADGSITMAPDVSVSCSIAATEGAARRYGRSILSCGV
ncbi:MAG: zinc ribbon domain-containing protein [Sphingomonadaceae bacterium]|nr:zinc ribbon domain-containing protein [Sphingomonadaceae bacterium]